MSPTLTRHTPSPATLGTGRATRNAVPTARGGHAPRTRDWRDDASCRTVDPELFFPIGNGPEAKREAHQAKAVCFRCPVRETCLRWALDTGQTGGIWGGLDERELRNAARRRAKLPTEQAGNVLALARKPKPKPKPPGPSIIEQVLRRRDELERLLADGVTHREAAVLIGVPGATRSTVAKAVMRIRKMQAAEQAPAVEAVAA